MAIRINYPSECNINSYPKSMLGNAGKFYKRYYLLQWELWKKAQVSHGAASLPHSEMYSLNVVVKSWKKGVTGNTYINKSKGCLGMAKEIGQ